jgi:hypothetical protein
MSKIMTWFAGVALAGVVAGCGQSPAPARAAGSWRRAIEVPGLGALNKGGGHNLFVGVSSVSCGAAGNCAAGGYYADRRQHRQGFVAAERRGRWGTAIEMPGPRTLNRAGNASVSQVSCGAAGNCAAGGYYTDRRQHRQGFVAAERRGRWGTAIEVPGLAALNTGGDAAVSSVSCPSAGNCTAAGDYKDQTGHTQGFVVSQRYRNWRTAIEVPGLAALNMGGHTDISSVSCGRAGNCAAVGDYYNRDDQVGEFAVSQRNGHWSKAVYLPGLKPNSDVDVEVDSVSCSRADGCEAVGTFGEAYGTGFVAAGHHGRWGKAKYLIEGGRFSGANSVSCAPAGNCAAGGDYSDDTGGIVQGAVVAERHGSWGDQTGVPGLKALNNGEDAAVTTVTCPPAGRCVAGGYYLDRHGHYQAFVTY